MLVASVFDGELHGIFVEWRSCLPGLECLLLVHFQQPSSGSDSASAVAWLQEAVVASALAARSSPTTM